MKTNDDLHFLKIAKQNDNADLYPEFLRIATILFEQFVLVVNGSLSFTLVEIEFYLLSRWHQDYFIYGIPEQLDFGEWCRHASGIDLSFGNQEEGIYAGILLRGIKEVEGQNGFINGPLNVRNALSYNNSKVTTADLRSNVALNRVQQKSTKSIFISNRYGLTNNGFKERQNKIRKMNPFLSQYESQPEDFIDRNYRFITDVCLKNRFKKRLDVAKESQRVFDYSRECIKRAFEW